MRRKSWPPAKTILRTLLNLLMRTNSWPPAKKIFSSQLLLPLLNRYHIEELHISSIYVTDLTSSPESLCFIIRRSRATSWNMICGSRTGDRNGGSSIADSVSCWLIVIIMADPLSYWHLIIVVDHDRGGSWWWILNGGTGQWLWDYSGIRSWRWILIVGAADHRLIAAGLPDI